MKVKNGKDDKRPMFIWYCPICKSGITFEHDPDDVLSIECCGHNYNLMHKKAKKRS